MDFNLLPGSPLKGPVDLTNCDREPIHIPAGIQSFGGMIVVRLADRQVVSTSSNLAEWVLRSPPPAVGRPLPSHLTAFADLVDRLATADEGSQIRERCDTVGDHPIVITGHQCDGLAFLEIESAIDHSEATRTGLIEALFSGIESKGVDFVYQSTVETVRRFTGFDRVMLYQFHEDQHGSVIAEAKREDQESFLGLHYPAGDIPVPARRLYELKWIRTVGDTHADPVPMQPPMIDSQDEGASRPINMAYCELRAISPIHLEYLRNMGVGASMSISILSGGRLWGLIACHHRTAKVISPSDRDACELAGSLLSTYLTSRRQEKILQQRIGISEKISEQVSVMANQDDLATAIANSAPWLAELFRADGFVWAHADDRFHWGSTPTEAETAELLVAVDQQKQSPILFTDKISEWRRDTARFCDRLPGLMVLRLGQRFGGTLLFFRVAYATTVQWAGDPQKNEADETGRLSPRKSFEKFTQSVQDRSRPWTATDRETAELLLSTLHLMVVEQTSRIQRINEELRRLNTDLDAFAYAASHDLKEPLRGIHHHVYLLEQAEELSGPTYERGMLSLKRLVRRMGELLDGLLRFSRAGRQELSWERFDLNEVVDQARDIAFGGSPPDNVDIALSANATVSGDFACVREILSNLFTNAVKYNEHELKRIEVGPIDVSESPLGRHHEFENNTFFVRDNGIGIPLEYQQQIFDIFTRLHTHAEYGGGSGAGLTIVRRMVERHGGQIAVESDEKSGSTFYFGWEPR